MIFEGILKIFWGLFALSFLILVHELGHYIAARLVGIKVEAFSIGLGRRLWGFHYQKTDFRFSLLPLGGYCRFVGENSFRQALEKGLDQIPQEEGSFYGASPWRRIVVSLAGPLANIILAILILSSIAGVGYKEYYNLPRIILASQWQEEKKIWPADKAGLENGDLILAINKNQVERFRDLRQFLTLRPNEELTLEIERDGRHLTRRITPELDKDSGVALIGILSWIKPVVGSIIPESLADRAGLRLGDHILAVEGTVVEHSVAFSSSINKATQSPLPLTIRRDGKEQELLLELSPEHSYGISFESLSRRSIKKNPWEALVHGTQEAIGILGTSLRGLRMLFLGIKFQNAVSGPLRLIVDTGAMVSEGFRAGFGPGLLWFSQLMAFISVSLALLNLLPIPILDGGQSLLFLIEIIRRKTIPPKIIYRYQFVGTIIILIIALIATTGDLIHFNNRLGKL